MFFEKTFHNFESFNLTLKVSFEDTFYNLKFFEFKLKVSLQETFSKLLKCCIKSVF